MDKVMLGDKEVSLEEIAILAKMGLLQVGQKNDTFATSNQMQLPHGYNQFDPATGGLFTRPGAEPDIFSAMRMPRPSLLTMLIQNRFNIDVILNPEYSILTGVRSLQGSTNEPCGDAPYSGFAKLCTTRNAFGRFRMKIERFDLADIGGRINRADVNYQVVNMPRYQPFVPDTVKMANNPNTALGLALMRFAVTAERQMLPVVYSGVAGTANGAFVSEFDGLDTLIRTDYIDVESGNTCDSAASLIVNRAGVNVATGGDDPTSANNIALQIGGILHQLERRAQQTGLDPVQWVIAMHPDLFEAIVRFWPQTYYTEGQIGYNTSTVGFSNTREMTDFRWDMTNGSYLIIRGKRFMVLQDDAIDIDQAGLGFTSDIYFVPMSALGGTPVTYFEAFNMGNTDVQEFQNIPGIGERYRVINGGFYAMTSTQTGECFEVLFNARPRIVMRTPWLAARLTNVGFNLPSYEYEQSPFPDGYYHVNGGRYETTNSLPYIAPGSED